MSVNNLIVCSLCGERFKKDDLIDLSLRIELDGSQQYLSIVQIANMLLGRINKRTFNPSMCKPIEICHTKCKKQLKEEVLHTAMSIIPFYQWVKNNYKTFEPKAEDLANDIMSDLDFPKQSIDRQEIKQYLYNKHASDMCMDCFDQVFTKYEKEIIKYV